MDGRVEVEAQPGDGTGVPGLLRRWAVARELGELQGARDPTRVMEVGSLGSPRRDGREPTRSGLDAGGEHLALDPGTDVGVMRESVRVEATGDRAQVESGATDQDRQPAARADSGKGARRLRNEVGDGKRLVRVDEVETVMRHPRPVGRRHLGRPDVEAAVDLSRVGRDDFGWNPFSGQPLREVE